ncbi:MAG: hypothetical protein Q6L68_10445, partial [Thermostichus sp. DG02_5_bins_236]
VIVEQGFWKQLIGDNLASQSTALDRAFFGIVLAPNRDPCQEQTQSLLFTADNPTHGAEESAALTHHRPCC